jgi:hypothetical protein
LDGRRTGEVQIALDYATLRAMAATEPANVSPYCPECGRPWHAPSPERAHPAAAFPWRPAVLAVVWLALAVTFGVRAARADQRQRAIQSNLAVLTRCLGGVSGDLTCPSVEDAKDRLSADDVEAATARGHRDRARGAAALGLFAVGRGLRGVARRRRRQDRPRSTLAKVWGLGESLLALTCFQVLALTLDSIAVQLSRGLPLSWEWLDTAADGVLVLVSHLAGSSS